MEFFLKIFGLDKKAGQLALEYAIYISLAAAFLLHLGDTLIAFGNCLVILSGAVSQLSNIGTVGVLATIAGFKLALAHAGATLKAASPDIHWCLGALVAAAAYLKIKLSHKETVATVAANAAAITTLQSAPPCPPVSGGLKQ